MSRTWPCDTTTKAIPLLGGMWRKNSSMASQPAGEGADPDDQATRRF
jgi:hypothetical protein